MTRFFEWLELSPQEAVEWQRGHPGDFRFVDRAYEWIDVQAWRVGTKKNRYFLVRSFFRAHRVALPLDDKHIFRSERPAVVGRLSVEDFRRILGSCNLMYKALFLVLFQAGLDVTRLLYVNTRHAQHVFDEVRKGSKTIQIMLPGRKATLNVRPYISFIGGDAVSALRRYFHSQGWKFGNVLFMNQYGGSVDQASINKYFTAHSIKSGVIKRDCPACLECGGETVRRSGKSGDGRFQIEYACVVCPSVRSAKEFGRSRGEQSSVRYGVNPHELRDLFRTEWHRSGADPQCAEHFLGHRIDPLGYDKIMRDHAYAKKEYLKALPYLNVLSEDPRKIERSEVDGRMGRLEEQLAEMDRKYAHLKVLTARYAEDSYDGEKVEK